MEAQEPYSSEGKSISVEGHPETWELRNLTALGWGSVPMKGYCETWEPRDHTVLRGCLLSRGVAALKEVSVEALQIPREGLSHAPSSLVLFIASLFSQHLLTTE